MRRSFFHGKDDLRIFYFEPNPKISQLMRLAEILLPANEAGGIALLTVAARGKGGDVLPVEGIG